MKNKRLYIILLLVIMTIMYTSYKLIKFNEYRYTVIDNGTNKIIHTPFADNIELIHLYPNLQEALFGYDDIDKIEGLENLTNLKTLMISDSPQLTKIEGLENLQNLEMLMLVDNNITKIEGLSGLKHLGYLQLENNQIETIENIEQIPVMKNDYCYTVPITENDLENNYFVNWNEEEMTAEQCFLESEPDEYIDKYLYDNNFEYGEMISPLAKNGIQIGGNPLKYITQESYDYIKKYKIPVSSYNYETGEFDDLDKLEII